MLVAKYVDDKGNARFAELVKAGKVQFGQGQWLLLAEPLHVKPHKRVRWWVPVTFRFEWIRLFN
jgi:sensor domain CHASE-containing protein